MGAACARAIAAAGRRTLLLAPAPLPGEATNAAAGMLAPQIEAHAGEALLGFAIAAREHYRALAHDLSGAGHNIGHHACSVSDYSARGRWEAEPGAFTVSVGGNSRDLKAASFTLK